MFVPNLYTLKDRGKQYGLHKFQDGVVMLAIQHECGDGITLAPPTEAELKYFEQYGERVKNHGETSSYPLDCKTQPCGP